jgi:hypothetical protein
MSQPELIHLPLSQLSISKLNMRHGRKAPDVSDILPSIREKGVRQTLLVRREGTASASSPDAAGSLRSSRLRRRPAAIRWCLAQ